jgi:hypothetical protein
MAASHINDKIVAVAGHISGAADNPATGHIREWLLTTRANLLGESLNRPVRPSSASGGATLVDAYRARLYYPPFYNEDRLATYKLAASGRIGVNSIARQSSYIGFGEDRAEKQQLGEVLLDTVTSWLSDGETGIPPTNHCYAVLAAHEAALQKLSDDVAQTLADLRWSGPGWLGVAGATLARAQRALSSYEPEFIHTAITQWWSERDRWEDMFDRLPELNSHEAAEYLGLEVIYLSPTARRAKP